MKNIFLLVIILVCSTYAQFTINTSPIIFEPTNVDSESIKWISIENTKSGVLSLNIKTYGKNFIVDDSDLVIASNDGALLSIKYSPNTNVLDKGLLVISDEELEKTVIINLEGSGFLSKSFYASTFNLYDQELKTELTKLISGHTSFSYDVARDNMYGTIDHYDGSSQVECVYTGRRATFSTRSGATSNNFNCEHTWPQSMFNENLPMKSDLYHLFPTDETANGRRSNYPFNKVVASTWSNGGSILGTSSKGATVFEPRDLHKGNTARAMLYFITRYPSNYGSFLNADQEAIFRVWNKLDSVDNNEKTRNDRISALQKNRNPYSDHPEFVDRITSFLTDAARSLTPQLSVFPDKILFDSAAINITKSKEIYIANTSAGILRIDSIRTPSEITYSKDTLRYVGEKQYSKVIFHYTPANSTLLNDNIYIYSNLSTTAILTAGSPYILGIDEEYLPSSITLYQNFPNPFNPETTIKFELNKDDNVQVKLFDLLGREVLTLADGYYTSGVTELKLDGRNLSSGTYIYQLKTSTSQIARKMTLLK